MSTPKDDKFKTIQIPDGVKARLLEFKSKQAQLSAEMGHLQDKMTLVQCGVDAALNTLLEAIGAPKEYQYDFDASGLQLIRKD